MLKEKKLHFMHINKTGGTSVSNFLEKQFKQNEVSPFVFLRNGVSWTPTDQILSNINDKKILEYKFFKGHLGWLPRTLFPPEEMETITFLREPIVRTLSYYNHLKGNIFHSDNPANQWLTFDDFVFDKLGCETRPNPQTRYFCAEFFFQKSFSLELPESLPNGVFTSFVEIDLTPNEMLQLAIERLHSCAFIGITEHFDESFEQLCMQYKLLPQRKIPKQNVSLIKTNKNSILPKTLERIIELNNLDAILYQEALKIFEERKKVSVFFNRDELEQEFVKKMPSSEEIKFTFEDMIVGEGWDSREGIHPNIFCWNSANVSTLVFSIKKHTDLFISFKVLQTVLSNLSQKLILTANSFPISLIHFHSDTGLVFEGVVSNKAFCKGDFLELTFSIPEVIRPADISESTDIRTLGFALSELEIKPITSVLLQTRTALFESTAQCQELRKEIFFLKKDLETQKILLLEVKKSLLGRYTAFLKKLLQIVKKIKYFVKKCMRRVVK